MTEVNFTRNDIQNFHRIKTKGVEKIRWQTHSFWRIFSIKTFYLYMILINSFCIRTTIYDIWHEIIKLLLKRIVFVFQCFGMGHDVTFYSIYKNINFLVNKIHCMCEFSRTILDWWQEDSIILDSLKQQMPLLIEFSKQVRRLNWHIWRLHNYFWCLW